MTLHSWEWLHTHTIVIWRWFMWYQQGHSTVTETTILWSGVSMAQLVERSAYKETDIFYLWQYRRIDSAYDHIFFVHSFRPNFDFNKWLWPWNFGTLFGEWQCACPANLMQLSQKLDDTVNFELYDLKSMTLIYFTICACHQFEVCSHV
jgi:hypothetical protein